MGGMAAFLFCLGASTLILGIRGVVHAMSSLRDGCRRREERLRRQFPDYGDLRYLAYAEVAGQTCCALCLSVMGGFLLTVVCAGW